MTLAGQSLPEIPRGGPACGGRTLRRYIVSPKTINIITNVIAILLAILEPVKSYLTSQEFNWQTFLLCLGGAVIGYFTGKSSLYKK
jgi:hypothetical protein